MDFYWYGLFFWVFLISSVLFLMIGISKKSWIMLLISTLLSIPMTYYFYGAENFLKLFTFSPLIPFFFLVFIVIRIKST